MIHINPQVTGRQQIVYVKKLSKLYGVRVYFYKPSRYNAGGFYRSDTGNIHISLGEDLISVFFHELGHKHCREMGIWRTYHDRDKLRGDQRLRSIIRTGLKAERWIDRWARNTMKLYFPHHIYNAGYPGKESKKWFHNFVLASYKKKLKNLEK